MNSPNKTPLWPTGVRLTFAFHLSVMTFISFNLLISGTGAYYAAQTGISMKLKDSESKKFLLGVLGSLESMKQEIGPNDAIDDEAVSAAYIENFAMKVFASADAEDRKGEATRYASHISNISNATCLLKIDMQCHSEEIPSGSQLPRAPPHF